MKVHYNLDNIGIIRNPVVTTGSFDGVHKGHKYIINRLNAIAKEIDGESVLITFHPHPRKVVRPEMKVQLINTQKEKIETLSRTGIDHLVVLTFTKDFARTSSVDFIRKILVEKLKVKKVFMGYDHQFGADREGTYEFLCKLGEFYNFEVEEIQPQDVGHVTVSSTKVRQALQNGDIKRVNNYLGHNYFIKGPVEHGSRFGRKIGYPTANIAIEEPEKLVPQTGVYAVKVKCGDTYYKGMLNVAHPTKTFGGNSSNNHWVKVHVLGLNEQIYNQYITIDFAERIRPEKTFRNVKSLIRQLERDKVAADKLVTI